MTKDTPNKADGTSSIRTGRRAANRGDGQPLGRAGSTEKLSRLSAREAAKRLGVSLPTLYAYVSRGLIRSEATGGSSRERRYSLEDIELLLGRRELRKNPARATREALHWGAPVLESGLTLISEGRLYYRGREAEGLAVSLSLEEVAGLLWLGDLKAALPLYEREAANPIVARTFSRMGAIERTLAPRGASDGAAAPLQRLTVALALAGGDDIAAYDLKAERTATTGARIVRLAATVISGRDEPSLDVGELLAAGWGFGAPGDQRSGSARHAASRLLNAALILCADHELNASAFAARVVASTGAHPYLVVAAGLAALQGARHGGATEAAEALIREALGPAVAGKSRRGQPHPARQVEALLVERLRRGEVIPGFGHRLYPSGDPRAAFLLARARETFPESPIVAGADLVIRLVQESLGLAPNLDFALGLLSRLFGLPAGSGLALFAVGRTVGWIAHAIEQYREGRIIRPRASYSGPVPTLSS